MTVAAQARGRSHPTLNRVAEHVTETLWLPYSYKPPRRLVEPSSEPGIGRTDALEGG